MLAFYFWMYQLQSWLDSMYACFCISPIKICMPPMVLFILLWYSNMALYFAYLALERGKWGTLLTDCTNLSLINDGLTVMYGSPFAIIIYILSIYWDACYWHWFVFGLPHPNLYTAAPSKWYILPREKSVGVHYTALSSCSSCNLVYFLLWLIVYWPKPPLSELFASFEGLGLPHYYVISCSTLFTLVLLWWQVPYVIPTPSQPLPQRPFSLYYLDQHVNMLRMHLCMLSTPLNRGWTLLSMMLAFAINSDHFFYCFVIWTFPLFFLSPSSACMYTLKHVVWSMCLCWYHAWLLRFGDEVKGLAFIVYEEIFSETRLLRFRTFLWFLSVWWFTPGSLQFSWVNAFKTALQPSSDANAIELQLLLPTLTALLAVLYKWLYLNILDFFKLFLSIINAVSYSIKVSYGLWYYLWSLFFRKSGYDFLLDYNQA